MFNELSQNSSLKKAALSFSDVASEIIHHIDSIHHLMLKAGIHNRPYTAAALNKLAVLDESQQGQILTGLKSWHTILSSVEEDFYDSKGNVNEMALVEMALSHFKLKLKDHKWDSTAKEQVWEIYNKEGIQLYRSLNFFRNCGYSLLDLCVNEWFILWERPSRVITQMNDTVAQVINGKKHDPSVEIGPHIIRETYDDGTTQPFQPRSLLVEFKNIYPTYSMNDQIQGLIVSSTATVIAIGEEATSLGFI